MKMSPWLAFFILSSAIAPAFPAETHCPGSVAGVSLRHINGYQMLVQVSANHSAPSDFLLDTGTQVTILDQSFANVLNLKAKGSATLQGIGFRNSTSIAQVDELAVGANTVSDLKVLVANLASINSSGLRIKGILGEDFLRRFDMLIDNSRSLLCLDDAGLMRTGMTGQRISLLPTPNTANGDVSVNSLIMSVRLLGGTQMVRLALDSGSDVPFLFAPSEVLAAGALEGHLRVGRGANGDQQWLVTLPPQTIKIGGDNRSGVSFLTLRNGPQGSRVSAYDGLLPTGIFRSIFVSRSGEFAVLDPNYRGSSQRESRVHRCVFRRALHVAERSILM
ncbi:hypothetical protein DYQ86_24765 [Acidobacteria bacterium AB60]|nr:hypothetical protein DYQ86_24765 [Acidobacteria bacterium AB60]